MAPGLAVHADAIRLNQVLAKLLVEQMGGEVSASSEPGRGATFSLQLTATAALTSQALDRQ